MDLIITVCDNAAGEGACSGLATRPPPTGGYADPSEGDGSDEEKLEAFRKTLHAIQRRLSLLISLPTKSCTTPCCKARARPGQPLILPTLCSVPHVPLRPPPAPRRAPTQGMSVFERYLTVWVFLCIVVGIGLGQLWPGAFQAIGRMEVARSTCPWAC